MPSSSAAQGSARLSLRGHLLALILVTLLPMLVLGGALIGWLAAEQRRSVEYGLQETARALALAVDREITATIRGLQALARAEALLADDLAAFHDRAVVAQSQHPYWANISLTDADGQILMHTAKPFGTELPSVGRYNFFQVSAQEFQPAVSGLITGPVSGKPVIMVAVPVVRNGLHRYTLAASIDPETWAGLLADFKAEPGSVVSVLDKNRVVIARNLNPEYVGQRALDWLHSAMDAAPDGRGIARGAAFEGHDIVAAFQATTLSGWSILAGLPATALDAPFQRTLAGALSVAAIVAAGSLLAALLIGRRISRPMAALSAAAPGLAAKQAIAPPENVPVLEVDRLWRALADGSRQLVDATRVASSTDARYRSIVDTAVDAMVVIDRFGVVQAFNRAAEAMFGYSAAEVVGQNVSMLMPEPDRSAHDGYVAHHLATGERRIIGTGREVQGRRKDGSLFPADLSVGAWQDGKERFFTGILRDITDRKAAEAALVEAKAEAERANFSKSKFLAAASHDLRQPLQSLFLMADALENHVQEGPGRSNLDHLQQGLGTLKELLDSLLDVSRLDTGVLAPEIREVPLQAILTEVAAGYGPLASAKGLELRFDAGCDVTIQTDRTLFGRLLRNLLENAVRYTNAGWIQIRCRPAADDIWIEVEDSGIGIPEDQLEQIFEEFHQVDNPGRDRRLGLGLAIVQRLSKLLDHPVEVRSTPGIGSTFSVRVPRGAGQEVAPLPTAMPVVADTAPGAAAAGLVLAVDDEMMILMGLEVQLQSRGYEVLTATSPETALDVLRDTQRVPDLILTDYRLGQGRTGPEVIQAVRKHLGTEIPGVILTGDTDPALQAAFASLDVGVAYKPVTSQDLAVAIQKQLAPSAQASPPWSGKSNLA